VHLCAAGVGRAVQAGERWRQGRQGKAGREVDNDGGAEVMQACRAVVRLAMAGHEGRGRRCQEPFLAGD
jgi:hypothetical protein